jgi:Fe-S cluster assembly scaffold protein SufB
MLSAKKLDERALSEFEGKITVGEIADNSDAMQSNENALLSDTIQAIGHHDLLISNRNVKRFHEATVGDIGGNTMFYMMNWGRDIPTCKQFVARKENRFAGRVPIQAHGTIIFNLPKPAQG